MKAFLPVLAVTSLCACASNYAVYTPPVSGPFATISVVNAAKTQSVSLATFDDGTRCLRRRHILIDGGSLPAGESETLTVPAGREFALFATLDTLRVDDYEIDVGVTGGGPTPSLRRSVAAIGCSSRLSFLVEPAKDYRVVVSEPGATESCSVAVSETRDGTELRPVAYHQRTSRYSGDEMGMFCEPLRLRDTGDSR